MLLRQMRKTTPAFRHVRTNRPDIVLTQMLLEIYGEEFQKPRKNPK